MQSGVTINVTCFKQKSYFFSDDTVRPQCRISVYNVNFAAETLPLLGFLKQVLKSRLNGELLP